MSRRPVEEKRARKLAKAMTRKTPTAYVDLIQWLKLRRFASTSGEARKLLEEGKVKVDSHPIGREEGPDLEAMLKDRSKKDATKFYAAQRVRADIVAKGVTVLA